MFNFTRYQLIAAFIIVGATLAGTVVLVGKSGVFSPSGGEIKFIQPGAAREEIGSLPGEPKQPRTIRVHVAGKVKKPGVYDLEPGSRVMDAIEAAGGALGDADLASINLAEKFADGQQVYLAAKGEIRPPRRSVARGAGADSSEKPMDSRKRGENSGPKKFTTPGEGTVNINSAGLEELQRLPGIGPAMARRIIDYRNEHGRFQSVEELVEVRGIGPKTLEKMRPFVSL